MLLLFDGFDGYSDIGHRWTMPTAGHAPSTTYGRFGTKGLSLVPGQGPRYVYRNLGDDYTELIAGVSCYLQGAGHLLSFYDLSAGTQVLVSAVGSDLRVYRGNPSVGGSAILATAAGALSAITGHNYYELRAVFDNSAGEIEVRLNGEVLINLGSLDTSFSGNAWANAVALGDTTNAATAPAWYDDIYCLDTVDSGVAGAPNNDFLGDSRVETLLPSGNGNSSQLVGSDSNSVDNYLLVDEDPENDDTDYVTSATPGDKDTYAYGNLSTTSGTIFGVQPQLRARKTDAGSRTVKSIARLAGVEEDGPEKFLSGQYVYYGDIREADPSGNAWTVANVNSSEFGVKVAA